MPPLPLLTQKEALSLARDAASDFRGLEILLQPVIVPRPLTDDMAIQGYILIVAGPRCCSPWFELRSALAYEHLYDAVYAHYGADAFPVDPEMEDEEPPIAPAEPGMTPLAILREKTPRPPRAKASVSS